MNNMDDAWKHSKHRYQKHVKSYVIYNSIYENN